MKSTLHQFISRRKQAKPSSTRPFVFVHIPKTAGTSFRLSLIESSIVHCDYGEDSEFTSEGVQTHIYHVRNFYELKKQILQNNGEVLTGHFPMNKFADFAPVTRQVTFVREPIKRLISNYNHAVSHNGYRGNISSFSEKHQNMQSRLLNSLPVELIGQLGITECYAGSIDLINKNLGTKLQVLNKNTRTHAHADERGLDDDAISLIRNHNEQDIRLYEKALKLHKARLEFFREEKEWTFVHATINQNGVLVGCAYFERSTEPVQLELHVNGNYISTFLADQFYGQFPKFCFPRERYIGIRTKVADKNDQLPLSIQLKVVTTQQIYEVDSY